MDKRIAKMLEEVSERLEAVAKKPVGLSECHNFPAYIAPLGPGVRTRWYACAWCGLACDLKKGKEGD